ncbi:MFS transporter [Methanospirillum lacunae]|uniref:MFS transporter n=1 Tax=Methanospirillum lacunae TaxID=668570 RepID=UPI001FE746B4|nr:MFS transporter [Methanospirillum lacunae]
MFSITSNHLHQKLLLAVIAIGMFLDGLDGSIVTIILPQISESFGTDTGTVSWVIITYLLMMAGLILIIGKTAERGHIKRIFLLGLCVFAFGSASCGFSINLELLLVSRIIQGIGAAMIAATATLLCVTYLPKDMLGMAFGTISMSVSIGVAAGPAIGGFIAQYLSWHWAFLINVPISIGIVILAVYVIPPDIKRDNQSFDILGAALLFGIMASGVYVLERVPHLGILDPQIIIWTAICIINLILFILREQTCQIPLIHLRIFKTRAFTATFIAFLLFGCVYMGVLYLLPFFLQAGMKYDPVISGLYLLIPPVLTAVIGIPMGTWSDRIGRRPFAIAGSLFIIIVTGILMVIQPGAGIIPLLAVLLCMGFFWGCAGGPVASRMVEMLRKEKKEQDHH